MVVPRNLIFFLQLFRLASFSNSDPLCQSVSGLGIQGFIPTSVSILFGMTKVFEFPSKPWFIIIE